ncbi:MAG TPA: family 78 glycoside hydrolase catalytic domain, partial [Puia sp.]|nr:family 78 glycoside hydrolase catalytic domain [Puia sp.]
AIRKEAGNIWSTGKIASSQSIQVAYQGKPLRSFTRYYWRVKVFNQRHDASSWSEINWFETAMMHADDWKAQWINDGSTLPKIESYLKEDRMPLFRKVFPVTKQILSARLYISGLGYYEAYLNGNKIGDHVLDPGFTTCSKEVLYAVYDIGSLVKKGNNVAGIMLGKGWYNPLPFKIFGRWNLSDYQESGRPCVKAEIHINYKDGSDEIITTDESWQTAPGPVTHNNIYLGEQYDARLEQKDFSAMQTDSMVWKQAVKIQGPSGKLAFQMQPAIKITRIIIPVRITEPKKDTFIVDMGQNFAGVAKIKVSGPAGTTVALRYGEDLFDDGSLNYLTTCATQIKKGGINGGPGCPETAWQEDRYTLKGGGPETWSPRFTFHGFRYVEITGWPGKPTLKDIEGLRMNADVEPAGTFACSNSMFNQLHETIQWTFLSNLFSVQSDCPAREKMGYGGDMVATANAFIYNYDMANFYRKSIQDFANEQRPLGGITEIAPFTGIDDKGYGDDSGPLGWELAFPYLQERLYDFYGDEGVISDNYDAFKKQLDFLKSKTVDGVFYWDISDHEALDAKPEALSAAAFYYHHICVAARFASILHKTDDSLKFSRQAQQIKNTIIQKFLVKGTGRFDNATQSAQLFALWYDLSPEKENTMKVLMEEYARHDWHISTGIFATKMMFDVLRENNLNDLAYRIANQRTYPGWGNMLEHGATTLWETWAYPKAGPSQNHPMFGSIDEWFYRSLLGINGGSPGFEKLIIKPQPVAGLTWARGSYSSIRGKIDVDWSVTGHQLILKTTVPANTSAEIWIPSA